jgi:hypothetical protein
MVKSLQILREACFGGPIKNHWLSSPLARDRTEHTQGSSTLSHQEPASVLAEKDGVREVCLEHSRRQREIVFKLFLSSKGSRRHDNCVYPTEVSNSFCQGRFE